MSFGWGEEGETKKSEDILLSLKIYEMQFVPVSSMGQREGSGKVLCFLFCFKK